jgi:TPP-dependent pyruvate/acetoin dehydrogenase alpha subunit
MQKKQVRGKKGVPEAVAGEAPAVVEAEEPRATRRKARPAPKARAGKSAKKAKTTEPVQQLTQDLGTVQSLLEEVVGQYRERLTTQLVALKESLKSDSLKESEVALMLEEIRALRLKPEKGRVKDLERLQDLVKRLGKRVPERA